MERGRGGGGCNKTRGRAVEGVGVFENMNEYEVTIYLCNQTRGGVSYPDPLSMEGLGTNR